MKLANSAIQLLSAPTTQDLYNATLFEALKLTNADCGSLFSYKENKFSRLYSSVPKEKQGIPSAKGFSYKSLKTGKPLIHTKSTLLLFHPEMYQKGIKEIIIIPLKHYDIQSGVLTLQCYDSKKLRKEKLQDLKVFGSLAGLSIQKSLQQEHLHDTVANRDLFMSIASHELKNPITTISMYAQLIRSHVEKNILPQKKWVDVLSSETSQLTELINDLLTKEKFSLYEMEYKFQRVDLREIIEDTLEKYQTTHRERQLIMKDLIKTMKSIPILADCNKIQQVISNILNNSAKFSTSDKPITITLSSSKRYFSFAIADQGPGIPKKNRQKLFDKFFKGDPHKEGMGLGLYVAKTIIDKHHGKIRVQSRINKGTTIQISLPKLPIN